MHTYLHAIVFDSFIDGSFGRPVKKVTAILRPVCLLIFRITRMCSFTQSLKLESHPGAGTLKYILALVILPYSLLE